VGAAGYLNVVWKTVFLTLSLLRAKALHGIPGYGIGLALGRDWVHRSSCGYGGCVPCTCTYVWWICYGLHVMHMDATSWVNDNVPDRKLLNCML